MAAGAARGAAGDGGLRAGIPDAQGEGMGGFITERNFEEAEAEFPGISAFYRALGRKPRTFLELVQLFLERADPWQMHH